MAAVKITKVRVDRLRPGEMLWDDEVRGFYVRRRQRDTSYILKYRAGSKLRYVTIGLHGSPWTPETARREAHRLLGAIHGGNDPAAERDRLDREMTVAALLDKYINEHVATFNKPTTRTEARRHVETKLKPKFGKLKISELSRKDVKNWHSGLKDTPYEANRSLACLRKALALAVAEWELLIDNPATGVKAFPEAKRERFFSDAELQLIGKALAEIDAEGKTLPGAIRVIRLLALTGMRLSEVVGTQWTWIDFEEGCLRLPDAKAGPRTVPLGGAALSYLANLDRIGPHVCQGTSPNLPISLKTVKRFWPLLRDCAAWNAMISGDVGAAARLSCTRMHDFRHTTGTLAALTGANAFIVRDVLGHRQVSTSGGYVSRVVGPLRKTADQVSGRIAAAMSGGPVAEIFPLRKSS